MNNIEKDIAEFLKENPEWQTNEKEGLKMLSMAGIKAFSEWQGKRSKQNA